MQKLSRRAPEGRDVLVTARSPPVTPPTHAALVTHDLGTATGRRASRRSHFHEATPPRVHLPGEYHTSVPADEVAISRRNNEDPRPVVWTKPEGEILKKVERARKVLGTASTLLSL